MSRRTAVIAWAIALAAGVVWQIGPGPARGPAAVVMLASAVVMLAAWRAAHARLIP